MFATSIAHAQAIYFVSKSQGFFQNSSAAPAPNPLQPFNFSVQSPTLVNVTPPSGSAVTAAFTPNNQDYEINAAFATKAALDAAYPNGTYRLSGAGIPTLNFDFTTELYPSTTPAVTGGTWSNGLLVIDPTQAATINFSTFASYATSGVAGHMSTQVQGLSDNVNLKTQIATQAVGGQTPSSTPVTSITIPARALTSGHVYQATIQFDTLSTLDTTSLTGGGLAVALWTKAVNFYIVAQAPGTTIPVLALTNQPTNQTGVLGGKATFNIGYTVGGAAPNQNSNVSVLWFFNGQQLNIDGVKYTFNGSNLTINSLTTADVGSYSAAVIAPGGIISSNPATLTLAAAVAPAIITQPVSVTVNSGGTAVFAVTATGTPAPTYQWQRSSGTPGAGASVLIPGATSPTLVLSGTTGNNAALAGNYSVVVSNGVGSAVTSSPATLTLASSFNDPGRLTNLSVLTDIAAGSSFTVGTVVGGQGTAGSKNLVVRAVGPSLGALGVPGTIGDPQLTLFNGASVAIANNDNWNGDPSLLAAMASVGAFAFTGPTSKDAAVYQQNLAPGNYSVAVSGVNGSVGSVIAEIYDATPAGTFTAASPRLVNVSVLKSIPSGGLLTLGFTLGGSAAKTVLIRVIGPGLSVILGSTNGTLGDPQLTLFNSNSVAIASNDDWGADPQLINVGTRVNAFAIGNTQSKDAMLVVTLPPGGYTAQARGNNGTSGLAIVEVYEVP